MVCDPAGSTFIQFLNLCGVEDIVAVDIIDEKLEHVKAHGAKHIINSSRTDITEEVRRLYPNGMNYVADASQRRRRRCH